MIPAFSCPPHVVAILSVGTWSDVATRRALAVVGQFSRFDRHHRRIRIFLRVHGKQHSAVADVLDARCNTYVKPFRVLQLSAP